MALLQDGGAMEQQLFKEKLLADYERKLSEMHRQLLTKQQNFEGLRVVMQQDMKRKLHTAQAELAHQFVDQSGAMSIETKTTFLESLQRQEMESPLQKENIALKQTLLKLQTLFEMQQQTRDAQSEKERCVRETHRMREAQLVSENTQLQQQIKLLEAERNTLSQDCTFYRLKWTNLQKQNEEAAQRRREAKIRALSTSYRRGFENDGELPTAAVPEQQQEDDKKDALDFDQQEEAFERENEVRIRTPRAHESQSPRNQRPPPTAETSAAHFVNATRHFQNEIKRLQLQLTTESKVKAALMDQVAQLKEEVARGDGNECAPESLGGLEKPPPASAKVRAASASVCSPRHMAPKRPSTSLSARAARPPTATTTVSPRAPMPTVALRDRAQDELRPPERAARHHRPHSSSPASHSRKFESHPRDTTTVTAIRGVAGVHNNLSVRERLPYR